MKVSIVTPSFNQLRFLRETANSVLGKEPHSFSLREKAGMRAADARSSAPPLAPPFDLEWIVIDGGSTDGSIDFLRSLNDPRLRWTTEKDAGQSDAVNKGLRLATGDIIGWLNSDDLYAPGAIATVVSAFEQHPIASWLVGRYEIINDAGLPIRPRIVRYKQKQLQHYSYRALLQENFIPQPAVFWRKPFGDSLGPLDLSLHYTMDYDLWLRMGKQSDPLFVDHLLAKFRVHGSSKTGVINRRQFDEGYEVARRHAGDDRAVLRAHRRSVEKIVWAYRLLRLIGR